ncbi:acyltransferase family protein [Spirosoma sp. HMF4905]|uniref:Acyltransferase family protein n=1 Tax=Spirosoma arboris TaxID=2682092 RepID=A0A7K1SRR2_9BACT|nr:acyltransferase [Spirosoma arboris]MVM36266.1 acyltransferase family protein [Spirosoma arboris]
MKLPYIDALRGMAILSVIWFHCHLYHYSDPQFYSFMDKMGSPAAMGVQLFYVVSAFTLFLSQQRTNQVSTHTIDFYIRRFFRIAPMYYLAMTYYLIQMAYSNNQPVALVIVANTWGIIANILLVHGLTPLWMNSIIPGGWSVGIEVIIYMLIPYLCTIITTLNRAIYFTACSLLAGYGLTVILYQIPAVQSNELLKQYLFFYLPYQLPVFGCGIIAYYVVLKKEKRVSPFTVCLAVSAISLIVVSKTISKAYLLNLPHTLHFWGSIGFIGLIIGLANFPVRLLVNPITRYIGKISYSAYLTHFGVLFWLDKLLPQQVIPVNSTSTNMINFNLKFILVVCLTILISTITYAFIEERGQGFAKRLLLGKRPSWIV